MHRDQPNPSDGFKGPNSPLRVLLLTPDFPPQTGGIQLLLSRLVEHAPGLAFRVVTLGSPNSPQFDWTSSMDVRRFGQVSMDRRAAALGLNAYAMREALRFKPDVILSGHVVMSLGAIILQKVLGVPFVQYVHADELRGRATIAAAAVRRADATIAVSRYTRDLVLGVGAGENRVRVIHPGVDLPSDVVAERDGVPTLLTVASMLFRYKGHDTMVRALQEIRGRVDAVRWIVIGDGPLRAEIEDSVSAAGLDGAVRFLGRVDDRERNRWLDRAAVFCMPSRLPERGIGGEGFGIAYMEAAAHCLPSIGGNVAGALDAVLDGETGFLVDPTDPLAVANAAIELLTDRKRAEAMGLAARRYAEEHAWSRIVAQVEELLREVVNYRSA